MKYNNNGVEVYLGKIINVTGHGDARVVVVEFSQDGFIFHIFPKFDAFNKEFSLASNPGVVLQKDKSLRPS